MKKKLIGYIPSKWDRWKGPTEYEEVEVIGTHDGRDAAKYLVRRKDGTMEAVNLIYLT